jgi:hypothetical protein
MAWWTCSHLDDGTITHSHSPSNFGYHWNHNGESQFLNGTAMGQKMVDLLTDP